MNMSMYVAQDIGHIVILNRINFTYVELIV